MNRRLFLGKCPAVAMAMAVATMTSCRGPGRPGGRRLRVMTYNLHHGEGVDGRLDLERIAAVIRGAAPDLVALQEVDRRARRTGGVDQSAEYARLTGMEGWFGGAMPFQGGEYGQTLLSRWPLLEPRVVRLPGGVGKEPRIAVTAQVKVPGVGNLQWTGCHLDASSDDSDRWQQVEALIREFADLRIPGLLAGDFNATPESRVMQRMLAPESGWTDTAGAWAAPTIPAEAPRSRIDYVLVNRPKAWGIEASAVLPEAVASDHRPLTVVLGSGR